MTIKTEYQGFTFEINVFSEHNYTVEPEFLDHLIYDSTTQPKKWLKEFHEFIQSEVSKECSK